MTSRAIAAGAELFMPVEDQSDGDRMGGLIDPFGHVWWGATRIDGGLYDKKVRNR